MTTCGCNPPCGEPVSVMNGTMTLVPCKRVPEHLFGISIPERWDRDIMGEEMKTDMIWGDPLRGYREWTCELCGKNGVGAFPVEEHKECHGIYSRTIAQELKKTDNRLALRPLRAEIDMLYDILRVVGPDALTIKERHTDFLVHEIEIRKDELRRLEMQNVVPHPGATGKVWNIARICHEANRAYCFSIGDTSQLPWPDAPEWQKDSAFKGVEFHLSGERTPEESHESWLAEKKAQGWKYGPMKNVDAKEHPCFLPYSELPEAQQVKDKLFSAIVGVFK